MNYNDGILEHKEFKFFKQLMYNIALALCVMLALTLVLVYGFKFQLYEVLSDSEYPYFTKGDIVVVKAQDKYEVGDIIKFEQNKNLPTTHRLIAIMQDGGKTYYICHGDNVQPADPSNNDLTAPWKKDSEYVQGLIDGGMSWDEIKDSARNLQNPTFDQIHGKVVTSIANYGTYVNYIKEHYLLVMALVLAIWCVSGSVQNELEIKKDRRLM